MWRLVFSLIYYSISNFNPPFIKKFKKKKLLPFLLCGDFTKDSVDFSFGFDLAKIKLKLESLKQNKTKF